MGLSVTVGMLKNMADNDEEAYAHYRGTFANLSRALATKGIVWSEPQGTEPEPADSLRLLHASSFPYSFLALLRRVYVLSLNELPVNPVSAVSAEQYAREEKEVEEESYDLSSHLVCHADYAGYYIPVDCFDPIFLPKDAHVEGGGIVGSSQRLMAELASCAPALGIRLDDDGSLPDEEAARLAGTPSDDPFEREKFAWRLLFEACRASVSSGHAIVFH